MSGFVRMDNPPKGDVSSIPSNLSDQLKSFDPELRHGLATIGSTAKALRGWWGISFMDIYIATRQKTTPLTDAESYELQCHNTISWLMAAEDKSDPIALAYMRAARDGWVTIVNGHIFPTQKLAALFCG